MAGKRLEGKVAFITGAARGMGRAHAEKMASHGADIIAVDLCAPIETVDYDLPTEADLAETVRLVESHGQRAFSAVADVRDFEALSNAVDGGVVELGRLDIVVANAGILNKVTMSWELPEEDWDAMIDINLKGVWQTAKAAIPHLLRQDEGGSIVLISSTSGYRGIPGIAHYNAAKHGVRGLARTMANELSQNKIRVNSVHPTNVNTPMIDNASSARIYRPDLDNPTFEDSIPALTKINMWPVPYVEPDDVANAVLFLASEDSRYVTGIGMPVDLGMIEKYSGA